MVRVLFREYARREVFIPGRCIQISLSVVVSNKYYQYLHRKTKVRHAEFLKIGARVRSGPPGLPAPPGLRTLAADLTRSGPYLHYG